MPTPEQMSDQGSTIPAELLAQLPERRGFISGAGPQVISQQESSLIGQVAALREEIAALRKLLAPPNSIILTGPDVYKYFRALTKAE